MLQNTYTLEELSPSEQPSSSSSSNGSDKKRFHFDLLTWRNKLMGFWNRYNKTIRRLIIAVCLAVYLAYLIWAIVYDAEEAIPLIVATCIVGILVLLSYRETIAEKLLGKGWESKIDDVLIPTKRMWRTHRWWLLPSIYSGFTVFLILYLGLVVIERSSQLRSLGGTAILLLISFSTSNGPQRIQWNFVIMMLIVHVVLALLVLRWTVFYDIIIWILDLIDRVVLKANYGAAAAFGDPWFILYPFVFVVSSIFLYAAATFCLIYGLLKIFSPVQSIKKFIYTISDSHLNAFLACTQPFSSGLPMYIFSFIGLSRRHIATGMLLTIPAGLALSNINYPETSKGKDFTETAKIKYDRKRLHKIITANNIYVMMYRGAVYMGSMIVHAYAMAIASGSILILADHVVSWFGTGVGLDITIPMILGYVLMPITYMLGTSWEESHLVAVLTSNKCLGVSTRTMTQLAYLNAGNNIHKETLSIATHTTLGFSYFGTFSMYIGLVFVLCPGQLSRLISLFPRMMFNASMSCLLTASVAHTITPESFYEADSPPPPILYPVLWVLDSLPGYKQLMSLANFN